MRPTCRRTCGRDNPLALVSDASKKRLRCPTGRFFEASLTENMSHHFFSSFFASSFFFTGGTYNSGTPSFFADSLSLPRRPSQPPRTAPTSRRVPSPGRPPSSCCAFVGAPSASTRFDEQPRELRVQHRPALRREDVVADLRLRVVQLLLDPVELLAERLGLLQQVLRVVAVLEQFLAKVELLLDGAQPGHGVGELRDVVADAQREPLLSAGSPVRLRGVLPGQLVPLVLDHLRLDGTGRLRRPRPGPAASGPSVSARAVAAGRRCELLEPRVGFTHTFCPSASGPTA